MAKSQMGGMRAVYLVCSEMTKRGLLAYPTSRNAKGADILATTSDCRKSYAVQVKSNSSNAGFWLIKKEKVIKSPTFFYVFVNIWETKRDGERIEYYVVPSFLVFKKIWKDKSYVWDSFNKDAAAPYKNNWKVFK